MRTQKKKLKWNSAWTLVNNSNSLFVHLFCQTVNWNKICKFTYKKLCFVHCDLSPVWIFTSSSSTENSTLKKRRAQNKIVYHFSRVFALNFWNFVELVPNCIDLVKVPMIDRNKNQTKTIMSDEAEKDVCRRHDNCCIYLYRERERETHFCYCYLPWSVNRTKCALFLWLE